jgi:hypothetical protein
MRAPDVAVAFGDGDRVEALRFAGALRDRDLSVIVEVLGRPWDEVAREALASGVPHAVLVAGARVRTREAGGRERAMTISDFLEQVTAGREGR